MLTFFKRRGGIASKLTGVAMLNIAALGSLSVASVRFAHDVSSLADHMRSEALFGLVASAELGVLVERHRRIIEAAPITFDKLKIRRDRRISEEIGDKITGLVAGRGNHFLSAIDRQLPDFRKNGLRVLELAENFAQDESLKAVGDYVRNASRVQDRIVSYREISLANARKDAEQLRETVRRLVNWILLAALFSAVLVGPLCLFAVRRIAERLGLITETMGRLAQNEIHIPIPSSGDTDELGEMARAVEVFKANAIALGEKHSEVARLNTWFDIALNNMARGLSMFDARGDLIVCNNTYRQLYDLPLSLAQSGVPFAKIVAFWASSGRDRSDDGSTLDAWLTEHRAKIDAGKEFNSIHRTSDGHIYATHCRPLPDGGWVDVHEDITEKQRNTERISELASTDTLTGLANRHSFIEELEASFRNGAGATPFAIVWIDLDRFKEVNDSYGHPAGDALLKVVAQRLRHAVRDSDFIARLGGDEFAIIIRSEGVEREELNRIAERLNKVIIEPCVVLGHTVSVGASIGISCAPIDAADPAEIMATADIALYHAKAQGRGRAIFYDAGMAEVILHERRLQADLEDALRLGQLELYYQPILQLEPRRVVGMEALMRWRHPQLGFVSPAYFIPLAEKTGLISALGAWSLDTACKAAVNWPDPIAVSVNLSAAQFDSADLGTLTAAALKASGLPASRLQFEVTETLLLHDKPETWAMLAALKELGVSIALDDFGTGYSSLSYLRSFPFDKIKVDQSFIRDLGSRAESNTIVRAIIDLARTLGMKVVAEGVETQEQLGELIDFRCDEVQGYFFSRPLPGAEIAGVLSRLEPAKQAA